MSDNFTLSEHDTTPPTQESMKRANKPEKKESSSVLNIIMIIVGLLFFGKGILDFVAWFKLFAMPEWLVTLHTALGSKEAGAALSFFGTQGIVSAMLGLWSFIAGILLFRAQESGWGMAIVILSTIAANGITAVIGNITSSETFDLLYWPNWVVILTTLAGILGFFFLLMTKKRYS
jgi:hypothetical protein